MNRVNTNPRALVNTLEKYGLDKLGFKANCRFMTTTGSMYTLHSIYQTGRKYPFLAKNAAGKLYKFSPQQLRESKLFGDNGDLLYDGTPDLATPEAKNDYKVTENVREITNCALHLERYGLAEYGWKLGCKFTMDGEIGEFVLIGFSSRARTYPYKAKNLTTGKYWKFSTLCFEIGGKVIDVSTGTGVVGLKKQAKTSNKAPKVKSTIGFKQNNAKPKIANFIVNTTYKDLANQFLSDNEVEARLGDVIEFKGEQMAIVDFIPERMKAPFALSPLGGKSGWQMVKATDLKRCKIVKKAK